MGDLDDLAKAVHDRAQAKPRAAQPPPPVPYARPMPPPFMPPPPARQQGPFMIAFKVMLGIMAANALLFAALIGTVLLLGAGCQTIAIIAAKNAPPPKGLQPAPYVRPGPARPR